MPRLVKAVDDGERLEAGAAAADPVHAVPAQAGDDRRRCTTACGWRSTAPAPAGRARIAGRDVAGKTGTAQVISQPGQGARARQRQGPARSRLVRVHGAARQPEIAGVVFAEHGEHGYLAAPIAKHVIETYFAKKEGRPLPALPVPPPRRVPARAGARPRRVAAPAGAAGRAAAGSR